MSDNFIKYRINSANILPAAFDLSKVKILWSKEKELAEEELAKKEEIKMKKEKEHIRLNDLVKFA